MNNTHTRWFAVIVTSLAIWSASIQASDQSYALTRISDNIHVIYGPRDLPDRNNRGFRNNVVLVSTRAGIVVFDPGGSAYAGNMVANQVKALTAAPIVAVFNSHAHGDHWLGNEGIRNHYPNVAIYGHPVMQAKLKGDDGQRWLDMINKVTQGTAAGTRVVVPDRTVTDGDVVTIGDTRFRIYHTGPAHTDNDIMIEVVGENALFTGDVVRNGLLGIMEDDASFKGNIAAIDIIVGKRFRHYIPGHGPVGGIDVPKTYAAYMRLLLDEVTKGYLNGLTDFEIKPAVMHALAGYTDWAGFDLRVGAHISRAYLEVEATQF